MLRKTTDSELPTLRDRQLKLLTTTLITSDQSLSSSTKNMEKPRLILASLIISFPRVMLGIFCKFCEETVCNLQD